MRVTDRGCVAMLDKVFGGMEPEQPIFELGATACRKRWGCVFPRLGFGTAQRPLPTPACLRGSGATALYLASSDLPLIAWRGRWVRQATLSTYIQEVATALSLRDFMPDERLFIENLSLAVPALLSCVPRRVLPPRPVPDLAAGLPR